MKIKNLIIFILIVTAFGAGVYLRDDAIKFYNNLNNQIQNFQKTEIGSIISKVGQEILAPTPLNVGGPYRDVVLLKSEIIEETNLQRQLNDSLPALKENKKLDEAAVAKANDMFLKQYFEHVSPLGVGPADLAQKYGYDYIIEGENLILGNFASEKELVQAWMDSPGHRANILNNRYTEIGVAIIKGTYKGETVWIGVQEFGLPLSSCSEPSVVLKNQINLDKMQLEIISTQINQLRQEIERTKPKSSFYQQMIENYNKLIEQYNLSASKIKDAIAEYNSQVNNFNNCVTGK